MTEPMKYQVTVRSLVPAEIRDKLAHAHAEALKAKKRKQNIEPARG